MSPKKSPVAKIAAQTARSQRRSLGEKGRDNRGDASKDNVESSDSEDAGRPHKRPRQGPPPPPAPPGAGASTA
jgi:hypothetical protein